MTMEDPVRRTIYFRGTGGTVLIGKPADSRDTNLYPSLFGPAQADDFTLDPPPPERGNGEIVASLLEDDLPVLRARYGKLDGFINFEVRYRDDEAKVAFTYYLSPDESRSLEWNGDSLVENPDLQGITRF
jgi:hypothetical protein